MLKMNGKAERFMREWGYEFRSTHLKHPPLISLNGPRGVTIPGYVQPPATSANSGPRRDNPNYV